MPRKPANLIYDVNDKPPLLIAFTLGLQHLFIVFISFIFAVILVQSLGDTVPRQVKESFLSMTMLAGGVVTILQANRKIGSGYLCHSVCGPSYMSASMLAVQAGGLPLLFGMTGFVGIVEVFFSRVMHRLRALFPAEVTGTVVAFVGLVIIPIAMENFLGISGTDQTMEWQELLVSSSTLILMIGLNVYSKGKLKLFCTIIGMVFGYLLALFLGVIPEESIISLKEAPIISVPSLSHLSWSFSAKLAIPFVIATLCSTLKTIGDLSTCQKINDADWKRPDMKSVSRGIFVDGLGGILPGLLGAFGQSTSSTNVGLSIATGATSRRIAYFTGAIIISLAFLPKLAEVFLIMPRTVMGATLIFAVSFMIIAGFQIIMSRMLDARKIFVVGISLIVGLSADVLPNVYNNMHPWLQPIFSSSLSLGAVTVVILNFLLRIGISKTRNLILHTSDNFNEIIYNFMDKAGSNWGARPEVIYKARAAMIEFMDGSSYLDLTSDEIKMELNFDELNLTLKIIYQGQGMKFPSVKPSKEEILSRDDAIRDLSGYLIRHYADKVRSESEGDYYQISLNFEH